MTEQLEFTFDATAEAASQARRRIASWPLLPAHLAWQAELVASELVTNGVRHAKPPLSVKLQLVGEAVRIEVSDGSPDLGRSSSSSRGLQIVDAVSGSWGVQHHFDGKTLWAEIGDAPPRPEDRQGPVLRQSPRGLESWMETLYRHGPTAIAIMDAGGRFTYCNPSCTKLLGYSEEQLRGLDYRTVLHPDHRPRVLAEMALLLAGEVDVVQLESRFVRKDGRAVYVSHIVSIVRNARNAPGRLIALLSNISDRKDVESSLRKSEERYRATFENAGLAITHLDVDGNFIHFNDRLCEMTGYTRDELSRLNYRDVTYEDDAGEEEEIRLAGQLLRREIDHFRLERQYVRKGGGYIWVNGTITAVHPQDPSEQPYLIAVIEDISARKLAEEALRASEAEAQRARERAELVTRVVAAMENVDGVVARARVLVDVLVDELAETALVLGSGGTPLAGRDRSGLVGSELLVRRVLEARSHVRMPLDVGDMSLGQLVAVPDDDATEVSEPVDRALIREIAERAGVLLSAARIRDEERRVAVRLQHALLPDRLVDDPRISITARYEASGASLQVGGDWYDAFALADGRVALTVGDVVGHGLEAAAAMGRLRTAIAALARRPGGTIAGLLDELDTFARGPNGTEFATACFAVLEPDSGVFRYGLAGHPPALVVEPDGSHRWLRGGLSAPLGAGPLVTHREAVTTVPSGSLLVLYSDGLVERRGEALGVGLDRLVAAAVARRDEDVSVVADGIVSDLLDGEAPSDDLVILCAQVGKPTEPVR